METGVFMIFIAMALLAVGLIIHIYWPDPKEQEAKDRIQEETLRAIWQKLLIDSEMLEAIKFMARTARPNPSISQHPTADQEK